MERLCSFVLNRKRLFAPASVEILRRVINDYVVSNITLEEFRKYQCETEIRIDDLAQRERLSIMSHLDYECKIIELECKINAAFTTIVPLSNDELIKLISHLDTKIVPRLVELLHSKCANTRKIKNIKSLISMYVWLQLMGYKATVQLVQYTQTINQMDRLLEYLLTTP